MLRIFSKIAFVGAILLALSFTTNGQDSRSGATRKVLNGTAKAGVVVVGTTAKYTWKAAKFTGGKVAKPIIVKSAPRAGKFVLRQTGRAIKGTIPVVKTFAITYLKFRTGL